MDWVARNFPCAFGHLNTITHTWEETKHLPQTLKTKNPRRRKILGKLPRRAKYLYFSTHFGSLTYRENLFISMRISVVYRTVSKLLRKAKSISFSTHFVTLSYRKNLSLFLPIRYCLRPPRLIHWLHLYHA